MPATLSLKFGYSLQARSLITTVLPDTYSNTIRIAPYHPNQPITTILQAVAGWQNYCSTTALAQGKYKSYKVNAVKVLIKGYWNNGQPGITGVNYEQQPPIFRLGFVPEDDTNYGIVAMASANPAYYGFRIQQRKPKNNNPNGQQGGFVLKRYVKLPQMDYAYTNRDTSNIALDAGGNYMTAPLKKVLAVQDTDFTLGQRPNYSKFYFGCYNLNQTSITGVLQYSVYIKYYVTLTRLGANFNSAQVA